MRENVRQLLRELTREEQFEVVNANFPGLAQGLTEERAMIDLDGVVMGYYVPMEKWLESQPTKMPSFYKNEKEAYEAAKNGPSPAK